MQKLSTLWQGVNSINKLIQQFEVHGPMLRLGDIGLVHHFKQVLNSCLRESIHCLQPCAHQVHNADPLSLETIQVITEAIRITVGGDATRGEEVTGDIKPMRSKAKESQDF